MESKHLIVFTCNWHAYRGMELAGASGLTYNARVLPIRLTCLSRISAGVLLKAFEQGALGVLLLGCPPETCQYETGLVHAEDVVEQARRFLVLLGYSTERIQLRSLTAETDQNFAEAVNTFLKELENLAPVPENASTIPVFS